MPHQINEEFAPRVENKFSKSTVVFKLLRHARSTMPYQINEECTKGRKQVFKMNFSLQTSYIFFPDLKLIGQILQWKNIKN